MHGGKSLVGAAVGTFKHGRYSEYLPERLLSRYHEATSDPDLLNLSAEIALVDAFIADSLRRLDTGESVDGWKKAAAAWKAFKRSGDDVEQAQLAGQLDDLFGPGLRDAQAREELGKVVQDRRRLVESERKRMVEMQQNITTEQAMTLVSALVNSVRSHVTDRATLAAIQSDLIPLLSAGVIRADSSA